MVSNTLYHLDEHSVDFPNPEAALREPNGLLAIGGDLKPERLISAYTNGIFPWYSADDPILWWSPNPRAIFYPKDFEPTQSLIKTLKRGHWSFSINLHFDTVVDACSEPRANENGTWITFPMKAAYKQLHQLNHAHSVEAYYKEELVGGLYGVLIGQVFCGESMYYHRTDASKLAFWALSHHSLQVGIQLIDAQVPNPHLSNLGSISVPRKQFLTQLQTFRNDKIDVNSFSPQTIKIPVD
jgi:leucyl/phenylalanyl-tRNA---protein transferase